MGMIVSGVLDGFVAGRRLSLFFTQMRCRGAVVVAVS